MSTRFIPQCSPKAAYLAQADEINAAIKRVLEGDRYILGQEVTAFETEFAMYNGSRHALGVANGTDAITIALKALSIGADDIVLTVSHTAVATVVGIRAAGANPLFVDVEEQSGLMDLGKLESLLQKMRDHEDPRLDLVKAIIPVHLYGKAIDMHRLCSIAERFHLLVIEDCAQAHGAHSHGQRVGTYGAFGCFSFYPTKNLGAIGDGGALITSNPDLLEQARLQREYGWRERYISDVEGGNSRLDELQAALLRVKLTRLDDDNYERIKIAATYHSLINHPRIHVPDVAGGKDHVYHQFAIRSDRREDLQRYLKERGVGTLVHYPMPIHQQPAYASSSFSAERLTHTELWASQELSLPIYPQLTASDVEYIASTINSWNPQP